MSCAASASINACTPRRVGLGGSRKEPAARRIRPERQCQALEQVTHPPDTDCLATLQSAIVIASPVTTATRRSGPSHFEVDLTTAQCSRPAVSVTEERPIHAAESSISISNALRTTTQDATEVRGTRLTDGGTSRILRARGQHDNRHSRPQGALQRLRPRSVIVDTERRRYQTERGQQIEQCGERRILDGHVIARCERVRATDARGRRGFRS